MEHQLDLFHNASCLSRRGGRMSNSDLSLLAQMPMLLDKDHPLTTQIVMDVHRRIMYKGVRETLTELRSTYGLVWGSSTFESWSITAWSTKGWKEVPTKECTHHHCQLIMSSNIDHSIALKLILKGHCMWSARTELKNRRYGCACTLAVSLEPFTWIWFQIWELLPALDVSNISQPNGDTCEYFQIKARPSNLLQSSSGNPLIVQKWGSILPNSILNETSVWKGPIVRGNLWTYMYNTIRETLFEEDD